MARDDHDRRRLRALYDRHKLRTLALAEARDRRRDHDDDLVAAPRHVLVSAQRLREAGFGRGGAQVVVVQRRRSRKQHGAQGPSTSPPRSLRFADRHIYRSSHHDRFRRDDDIDRELRRERALLRDRQRSNNTNKTKNDNNVRARRGAGGFGIARQRRLRMRQRESGAAGRRSRQSGGGPSSHQQPPAPQQRSNSSRGGQQGLNRRTHADGQHRSSGISQQQQQQQQQRGQQNQPHRGGNRNPNEYKNRPFQRSDQRPRAAASMPTHEQLNAQLDSYRNS